MIQGGPMSTAEMKEFEQNPLHQQMIVLRSFDEQAKLVDYETPDLESFREMVRSYLLKLPA